MRRCTRGGEHEDAGLLNAGDTLHRSRPGNHATGEPKGLEIINAQAADEQHQGIGKEHPLNTA